MTCMGCKYWSEMIAGCDGGGPVKAYCLHPSAANKSYDARMVYRGCDKKEPGEPLDAPGGEWDAEALEVSGLD